MKKQKGFTLIELMIVIAIIGILGGLLFGGRNLNTDGTICQGGYKFVSTVHGVQQVLSEQGGGVPCK